MGKKFWRVNHNIHAKEVFLVDETGYKCGIVPLYEAKQRAEQAELDLVEVAPNSQPPVCKIIDFGKFKYEQEKQERKQKARNKGSDLKEIRLSLNINDNDFQVKVRKGQEFLQKRNKVKVNVRLKGREMSFMDKARLMLEKYFTAMQGTAKIEQATKRLGTQFIMIMAPSGKSLEVKTQADEGLSEQAVRIEDKIDEKDEE